MSSWRHQVDNVDEAHGIPLVELDENGNTVITEGESNDSLLDEQGNIDPTAQILNHD